MFLYFLSGHADTALAFLSKYLSKSYLVIHQ